MKKLITTALALTALFMLGACTSDDSVSQSVDGTTSQDPLPIGFDSYLGRAATTRGGIYNSKDDLGQDGVGVYAMYSKDQGFSTDGEDIFVYEGTDLHRQDYPTTTKFNPNYMRNVKVWDKNKDGAWTYSPVRYWPMHSNEFVTFLAYGPWQETNPTLYTKTVTTTTAEDGSTTENATFEENGDNPIYMKYELNADPTKQYDFMWNYNQTWNMQFYVIYFGEDGRYNGFFNNYQGNATLNDKYADDLWSPADKETYPGSGARDSYYEVKLKMAHATSRIAYSITSPALKNKDNFAKDGDENSNTQIKINKLVFLGDAKSGASENPKGAFYKEGYLNMAGTSKKDLNSSGSETKGIPQWEGIDTKSEDKLSFTFTNFYDGTYDNTRSPYIWQPGETSNNVLAATQDASGNVSVNSIGNASNGYLFVIPQDLSLTDEEVIQLFGYGTKAVVFEDKPLYCYIEYTVQYKDMTTGMVTDGVTYESYGVISQNFEAGKAYVIHIQIGSEDGGSTSYPGTQLNTIHFKVETDPWDNEQEVSSDAGWQWTDEGASTTGKL